MRIGILHVCNRGKGGTNVCNFPSFHFLSAVVPAVLSKDRPDHESSDQPALKSALSN